MPLEVQTRITLLLPAPTTVSQFQLVDKVLTGLIRVCSRVGVSAMLPPGFDIWRFNPNTLQTEQEGNLLIMADTPVPVGAPGLLVYLEALKLQSQRDFAQDIIWVTIHRVERIATHDHVH